MIFSRITPNPPPRSLAGVVSTLLLLGLLAFFCTAVVHHLQVAMDGWHGFENSGMVGRVYTVLIQPLLESYDTPFDPNDSAIHYLWALAVVESLITLFVLLAKRKKPLALILMATYILLATSAVVFITPGVGNRLFDGIDCGCTNPKVLELFGPSSMAMLLIRNAVMVGACLWLATQWKKPTD